MVKILVGSGTKEIYGRAVFEMRTLCVLQCELSSLGSLRSGVCCVAISDDYGGAHGQ